MARTAFLTELSHESGRIFRNNGSRVQIWAISLDFQKLFNSISVDICARVMEIMGVHPSNVSQIAQDIKGSAGYWRLPCQSVSPLIRNTRGLPQGLSTSVLLAETLVSLLMRRLVSIPDLDSVLYVDDVTLAVKTKASYLLLLSEVLFFAESFSLTLSGDKSVIWGTEELELQNIAREQGFTYARQVTALGAEWATHPKPVMKFTKEHARLAKLRDRLLRMSHLPASLSLKLQTLSVGILSLLDFIGFPDAKELSGGLRAQIRSALGLSGGALKLCSSWFTLSQWILYSDGVSALFDCGGLLLRCLMLSPSSMPRLKGECDSALSRSFVIEEAGTCLLICWSLTMLRFP